MAEQEVRREEQRLAEAKREREEQRHLDEDMRREREQLEKQRKEESEQRRTDLDRAELRRRRERESEAARATDIDDDWAERRDAYTAKAKALSKLKRCDDHEYLEVYLRHFKKLMQERDIDEDEYCDHLRYSRLEKLLNICWKLKEMKYSLILESRGDWKLKEMKYSLMLESRGDYYVQQG